MIWIVAGVGYAVAYVVAVSVAAPDPVSRLWVGDLGLLASPLVPIIVLLRRRRAFNGRPLIFWTSLASGCAVWMVGHLGWSLFELGRHQPLPWLQWPVVVKLTGAILPSVALVAWPHAQIRGGSLSLVVLDIAGVTLIGGFLFWSLIVAPGLAPSAAWLGILSLVAIASALHIAIVGGFALAAHAAGEGPWRTAYRRLAIGAAVGSALLIANAPSLAAGTYVSGSVGDVGWILPFWFFAWAMAEAPGTPAPAVSPINGWTRPARVSTLLLVVVAVPLIGYGPRFLAPLGRPVDDYRELATTLTVTAALGLTMIRLAVEQRARHRSDYRLWLLATACEQSSELIVIIRRNSIEYANDAFCRSFGYSLEELQSLAPQTLVDGESMAAVRSILDPLRRGELAHATLVLRRRDLTSFQADCTIAPFASASGRTSYFVGVVRDRTEDLRLRDQLVRRERMSAVGQLAAGVAHELNNPLQSVIGLAQLMLKEQRDPSIQADLERLKGEADRASRIIRNLLFVVRKSPAHRTLLDLNEIARSTVAVRRYELEQRRITVREDYTAGLPAVLGSRDELQQVVWQLIANAEWAMSTANQGGSLGIRTSCSLSGGDVILDVTDDGRGIPPDVARLVFEPFFSTKPVGEGTGLGLSIAFGIATAHGGSLELMPSVRGASFRLTLPGAGSPCE